MTQTQQPEALHLAEKLRDMCSQFDTPSHERGVVNGAIQELRSQHARIKKLEAQLSAIGALADTTAAWVRPVSELLGHISDVLPDNAFDKIDTAKWNAVSALVGATTQATAAPQIDWESAAEKIAIEVADNCGTVPNLTHPYIYLGLKKLFASHPTQQKIDAQELLAALGDLSFACFGGIGTKAPDAATYNRTFAVLQKHRDAAQAKKGGAT